MLRRVLTVACVAALLGGLVAFHFWRLGWRERLPRLTPVEMQTVRGVR